MSDFFGSDLMAMLNSKNKNIVNNPEIQEIINRAKEFVEKLGITPNNQILNNLVVEERNMPGASYSVTDNTIRLGDIDYLKHEIFHVFGRDECGSTGFVIKVNPGESSLTENKDKNFVGIDEGIVELLKEQAFGNSSIQYPVEKMVAEIMLLILGKELLVANLNHNKKYIMDLDESLFLIIYLLDNYNYYSVNAIDSINTGKYVSSLDVQKYFKLLIQQLKLLYENLFNSSNISKQKDFLDIYNSNINSDNFQSIITLFSLNDIDLSLTNIPTR